MSDSIISIENLGKKYLIRHEGRENYTALRDVISDKARQAFRNVSALIGRPFPNNDTLSMDNTNEEFWALKDVSFDVKQGEVVGIIGRNGAGKSTLLKILSRITEPTTGLIRVKGRVASLLEVGTGFHPELTGKENIFLNGAILGMSKTEIKQKFDEIVAFAEIEKFLDTPVKRYSSGMYVRLAFAVAAHLDPEILLLDEVLAVGDAAFQKKCLGKMQHVGRDGKTVLFVSHNLQAVKQLCSKAIFLDSGRLHFNGDVSHAVEEYLNYRENVYQNLSLKENISSILTSLPSDPVIKFNHIELTQNDRSVEIVENGSPLHITIDYSVFIKTKGLRIYFDLCDMENTIIFRTFHDENNSSIPTVEPGHYTSSAIIPENLLGPTHYMLIIRATIHNVRSCISPKGVQVVFSVTHTGDYNKAYIGDTFRGKMAPVIEWNTQRHF